MKRSRLERRTPLARGESRLRRAPLERGEPLRAKRWGIAWKPARRIAKEAALRPRLAFAAARPCVAYGMSPCRGPAQVAHVGKGGMALRHGTPMHTLPLCGPEIGIDGDGHHQQYDQSKGAFDGWSRAQKDAWTRARLAEINAAFAERVAAEATAVLT